jgi:uncharacterized protein
VPAALVDTSAMVAAFGARQRGSRHYEQLFAVAAEERWQLVTTWPCVTETSYMLAPKQRYGLLRWVAVGGLSVFPFGQDALDPMVEMMRRYTTSPRIEMDLADASLVWLAADTGVTKIMTLDVRDFSRYRLPDGRAFEIL